MPPTHAPPTPPRTAAERDPACAAERTARAAAERAHDAALVARAMAGDDAAFGELVARHRGWCRRVATRLLGCEDEAEDVVQVSLARAHRAIHQCTARDQFAPWLRKIVLRRCYSVHERRTRRGRWVRRIEAGDEQVGVDADVRHVELRLDVARAMAALPDLYRDAVTMRYLVGLDYREMTAATGVGCSALKMRVQRGCARLRDVLPPLRHDAA
ncbi:MAG: RNA polymerase sigma factor [Gemmatirosa sp.]